MFLKDRLIKVVTDGLQNKTATKDIILALHKTCWGEAKNSLKPHHGQREVDAVFTRINRTWNQFAAEINERLHEDVFIIDGFKEYVSKTELGSKIHIK